MQRVHLLITFLREEGEESLITPGISKPSGIWLQVDRSKTTPSLSSSIMIRRRGSLLGKMTEAKVICRVSLEIVNQ